MITRKFLISLTLINCQKCLKFENKEIFTIVSRFVLILCEVHVEVVKKSILLFQNLVSVSVNQMKPPMTKIHEMCNKM